MPRRVSTWVKDGCSSTVTGSGARKPGVVPRATIMPAPTRAASDAANGPSATPTRT